VLGCRISVWVSAFKARPGIDGPEAVHSRNLGRLAAPGVARRVGAVVMQHNERGIVVEGQAACVGEDSCPEVECVTPLQTSMQAMAWAVLEGSCVGCSRGGDTVLLSALQPGLMNGTDKALGD